MNFLATDADSCYHNTVADCLNGERIETSKDISYEILNYQTGFTNPRARVITNKYRPLNLVTALARFTWLMAGNNRVQDIAFYEPKVWAYTDDNLIVPGSSYGARLFDSAPGLNQIEGVIDRLSMDPGSRQAACVVWLPSDAVRDSGDIPCTFGMFFLVRAGYLHMTTVMRSNNAYRLLPFNLFEFSMLQEVVASTLGFPLGHYHHWSASMHVYHNEHEFGNTKALADADTGASIIMEPMPPASLGQAKTFARLEAKMRHVCDISEFEKVMHEATEVLHPYWSGLFNILAAYHSGRRGYRVPCPMPSSLYETVERTLHSYPHAVK